MVPIFLHVLHLQLVATLSEDWLWVFLKAPRQNTSLPRPCIYPAIHINYHWRQIMKKVGSFSLETFVQSYKKNKNVLVSFMLETWHVSWKGLLERFCEEVEVFTAMEWNRHLGLTCLAQLIGPLVRRKK